MFQLCLTQSSHSLIDLSQLNQLSIILEDAPELDTDAVLLAHVHVPTKNVLIVNQVLLV